MSGDKFSVLAEEVRQWNTPLLGGYLLWQFTRGYCDGHPDGDAPIGLLHFIASAILTSPQLSRSISDRRRNLQSYIAGFEDLKESDRLLTIHDRIQSRREYTLAALDAAVTSGLLFWDTQSGKVYPREISDKTVRGKALRATVTREGKRASILGRWFSEHDEITIASYLRVNL